MKNENNENLESWQTHFFGYLLGLEQNFLTQALPMKGLSTQQCVEIYKRGYQARLVESLGDTFSATWWVIGDDDYFKIAGDFVGHIPSRSCDLSDYGKEFPEYLKNIPISSEIPFVPDLARFEWNFKTLFHSKDMARDKNILSQLSENPNLKLRLLPSVTLWRSNYSIYEIWKRRESNISSLNEVEIGKPENILCQKVEGKVHMNYLEESEFKMLMQFESPRSIDEAVALYEISSGKLNSETIQGIFSKIGSLGVLSSNANSHA